MIDERHRCAWACANAPTHEVLGESKTTLVCTEHARIEARAGRRVRSLNDAH